MADLLFDWIGFSGFAYVKLDRDLQVWLNPNQSNRRYAVQLYFPLQSKWVLSACSFNTCSGSPASVVPWPLRCPCETLWRTSGKCSSRPPASSPSARSSCAGGRPCQCWCSWRWGGPLSKRPKLRPQTFPIITTEAVFFCFVNYGPTEALNHFCFYPG